MVSTDTFKNPPSLEEYISKEINFVKEISKYNIDYFGIFVEPTTMSKRMKVSWNIDDWKKIVEEVTKIVKNSKTFISLLIPEAEQGINEFLNTNVDIIGINVWNDNQLEKLDRLDLSEKILNHNKEPWIWMNWWANKTDLSFWSCINQTKIINWLEKVEKLAEKDKYYMISPFFTEQFFYCMRKNENPKTGLVRDLTKGFKTPAFFAYYYLNNKEKTSKVNKFKCFNLDIASESVSRRFSLKEWISFLDIAQKSKVNCVSLYIEEKVYRDREKDYDKLISEIKKRKLKLFLRPLVLFGKIRDQKKYFDELLKFKLELIEKYKPDAVLVANEPAFLGSTRKGKDVPTDLNILREYLNNICNIIKRKYPNIKTFVTINKEEYIKRPEIIDVMLSIKNLDAIAFNIYGAGNLDKLPIEKIKKEVWLFETWFGARPGWSDIEGIFTFWDCNMQLAICGWLSYISDYENKRKMFGIMPWFSEQFVHCLKEKPKSEEELLKEYKEAILNKETTKSFECFKDILIQ